MGWLRPVALALVGASALLMLHQRKRRHRRAASAYVYDRLTVVITTSPTRSNPSTKMLELVVNSLDLVPHLQSCRKVIVCDGSHWSTHC